MDVGVAARSMPSSGSKTSCRIIRDSGGLARDGTSSLAGTGPIPALIVRVRPCPSKKYLEVDGEDWSAFCETLQAVDLSTDRRSRFCGRTSHDRAKSASRDLFASEVLLQR